MSFTRVGTANVFDASLQALQQRQSELSQTQLNMTAGKRVLRPSDDPSAAALAERAITRQARVTTDQRALESQSDSIKNAESTLGDAGNAMQDFRALVVSAGSPSLSATDRASIAQQMQALRDQLFGYANTRDTNGLALFSGLGSTDTPFTNLASGVTYNGIPGQQSSTDTSITPVLDGYATWMDVPKGNGTFVIGQTAGTSTVFSDAGTVTNPSLVTGHNYSVNFTVSATGVTTYDVVDNTTSTTVATAQPYTANQSIGFDGISMVVSGVPTNGDSLTVSPSTKDSLFGVLDSAIAAIKNGGTSGVITQKINQSLTEIDSGMARLMTTRTQAGELLNRVDRITDRQDTRSIQLEADRSRAEDLDMVKALSDFQTKETAYTAALNSYAKIQKLSLFDYLG